MLIRDLTPSDTDVIWDINQANTPALGDETLESMHEILLWSSIALGVEVDQQLVGFCLLLSPQQPYTSTNYRWFCDRYQDFIYLDRVGFSAAHQGQGYGAALYAEVERLTKAAYFTLEVNLDPPNDGSIRFHQRLGFTEVGQQITTSGKLVSLMAKKLE
jgi:predicted GNAT superfamily acetyltransferase